MIDYQKCEERGLYNLREVLPYLDTTQEYEGYLSGGGAMWTGIKLNYNTAESTWYGVWLRTLNGHGVVESLEKAEQVIWHRPLGDPWVNAPIELALKEELTIVMVRMEFLPALTEEMYF